MPTISYSEAQDVVILREFTSMAAIEHMIPSLELRFRDPMTGEIYYLYAVLDTMYVIFRLRAYIHNVRLGERYRDTKQNKLEKFKEAGVKPVRFDLKGNYGVAINWR